MCKNIFEGNIYVRSKFSCVRSFHDLCAYTHAHALEGTLVESVTFIHIICQRIIQNRKCCAVGCIHV